MKITLHFDGTDEDTYRFRKIMHADETYNALTEIQAHVRAELKYQSHPKDVVAALEKVRDFIPYEVIDKINEG